MSNSKQFIFAAAKLTGEPDVLIEERGGAVARDILRDKIEGKGLSRRTVYRRIEEAEKLKLIKFQKGKDAYELY